MTAVMGRPGLSAHPKFRRLAVLLTSRITARGVLELLWESAYDALDDELGTAAEIAYVLGVPEATVDPIVAALVACGFIDESAPGRFCVHQLWDHCPDYVLNRCHAQGERLSTRRIQAGALGTPSHPSTEHKEQRAARDSQPVENPVDVVDNRKPPAVLLRAGFAAREQLEPGATETDLKEDLKRIVAHADLRFDAEAINRALDVVTRVKPLQATLEGPRPRRSRRQVG